MLMMIIGSLFVFKQLVSDTTKTLATLIGVACLYVNLVIYFSFILNTVSVYVLNINIVFFISEHRFMSTEHLICTFSSNREI